MKALKIPAMLLALLFVGTTFTQARPNNTKHKLDKHFSTKMISELGLTEAQVTELKDINATYDAKAIEARQQAREAKQEINENRAKDIVDVLSPEQLTKLAELQLQKEMRQGPQGRQGNQQPPREMNPEKMSQNMAKKLNLDEKQSAELLEINKKYSKDMRGLSTKSKDDMQQSRQELEQSRDEEILNLLTPEQQEQFSQLKKQQKSKPRPGKGPQGNNMPLEQLP